MEEDKLNKIEIAEKETIYDVDMRHHSDLKNRDYDLCITAIEEADGRVSLYPRVEEKKNLRHHSIDYTMGCWNYEDEGEDEDEDGFKFIHSDPDRVIALANMMIAAAKMVKDHNI